MREPTIKGSSSSGQGGGRRVTSSHGSDQRGEAPEQKHRRLSTEAIGKRPEDRLHDHVGEKHSGHDHVRRAVVHVGGIDQVLLHVSRESIEDQRPAGGIAKNDQERPGVMLEDFAQRTGFLA